MKHRSKINELTPQYGILRFNCCSYTVGQREPMSMRWDCLWTAAISGPTVHPPDEIWVRRSAVEWYWQEKPTNSEKNLTQCRFVYHKSHSDSNLGLRGSDRRLTAQARDCQLFTTVVLLFTSEHRHKMSTRNSTVHKYVRELKDIKIAPWCTRALGWEPLDSRAYKGDSNCFTLMEPEGS
jgi:hypothetical protein